MTNWPAGVWGCLLTLTLGVLLMLLFYRGWMIEAIDKRCTEDHKAIRAEWEAFREEQEKWHELIKQEQRSPWDIHSKSKTA